MTSTRTAAEPLSRVKCRKCGHEFGLADDLRERMDTLVREALATSHSNALAKAFAAGRAEGLQVAHERIFGMCDHTSYFDDCAGCVLRAALGVTR